MSRGSRTAVALASHNGERFIKQQLDSVLSQTLPPDRVVVADDASTDSTLEILRSIQATTGCVVVLTSNKVLGVVENFARACRIAAEDSDLVFLCDQDDVWLPKRIQHALEIAEGLPKVGLIASNAELIDEQSKPLGVRLDPPIALGVLDRRNALRQLLEQQVLTGATLAVRSELLAASLPFPSGLGRLHDAWIGMVAAATSQVVYTSEPMVLYRQHDRQLIGATRGRSPSTLHPTQRLDFLRDAALCTAILSIASQIENSNPWFDDKWRNEAIRWLEARRHVMTHRAALPTSFRRRLVTTAGVASLYPAASRRPLRSVGRDLFRRNASDWR